MSRSPRGAAASAMRSGDLLVEGRWMQGAGGRRAFSLACVIGRHRVSASTHAAAAAPFSPASFHSRHIRCDAARSSSSSRPNSIIFGDGRRPRGAIGDWAGCGVAGATRPGFVLSGLRGPCVPYHHHRRQRRPQDRAGALAIRVASNVRAHHKETPTNGHPDVRRMARTHTHTPQSLHHVSAGVRACVFSRYRAAEGEGGSCRGPASAALRHSSSVAIMTCARPPLRQFDPRRCQLAVSATTGHPSIACTQLISPP